MSASTPTALSTRSRLHDATLAARALLYDEALRQLEGVYGLYADGHFADAATLPALTSVPEAAVTRHHLANYMHDARETGVSAHDAVTSLAREVAFTWLNRMAAFKLLEARKLIRQSISRGMASNGFQLWLAEEGNAEDAARFDAGGSTPNDMGEGPQDVAYRHYLLALCEQQSTHIRVLFDPDALPSLLVPRPRVLAELLTLLNEPLLASAWLDDETIGWIYQFFNEQEKAEVFARLNAGKKIQQEEIPAATQLFTPRWIVQALVENSLGRLWLQMHPNSRLREQWLSLIPEVDAPPVSLRLAREITFLDPACGTMHFGLVAFDLFHAMYQEERERIGEAGWPDAPSVAAVEEIPAAIIKNNIFGMDIDLRAVQLSALALFIKARSLNRDASLAAHNLAWAIIADNNLAYSTNPLPEHHLELFLEEAYHDPEVGFTASDERLMRDVIWKRMGETHILGSLAQMEADAERIVEIPVAKRSRMVQPPITGLSEDRAQFWEATLSRITMALDHFADRHGLDERFFTQESRKGLTLFRLMQKRYDVVATNPPYMSSRNMPLILNNLLKTRFPTAKGDLYAAFIVRCSELAGTYSRMAMLTQQSFMSISSYEALRGQLREQLTIETLLHIGPHGFEEIGGEKVNTVAFVLRRESDRAARERSRGVYLRLVREPDAAAKRHAFAQAVAALRRGDTDPHIFRYQQSDFDAIPDAPWVYYITESLRNLFTSLPKLGEIAPPKSGMASSGNERFLRYWWEIGKAQIGFNCENGITALATNKDWFPYMKGGEKKRWWGNQEYIVNWGNNGRQLKAWTGSLYAHWSRQIKSVKYFFMKGVTWTDLTSGRFNARLSPGGFIFDVKGSSAFPDDIPLILGILNSSFAHYMLSLLNPTVSFQVGDLARLPIPTQVSTTLHALVERVIGLQQAAGTEDETTYDFVAPPAWATGLADAEARARALAEAEAASDEEVYRLYGISADDRAAIAAELANPIVAADEDAVAVPEGDAATEDSEEDTPMSSLTDGELALRWVSYAVGIVLGRFRPGEADALGRGNVSESLAQQLRALVVPHGIAVLDGEHPDDLAALVARALDLLLGHAEAEAVIQRATNNGDLRGWLGRDFFKDHLKRYRKRPIYWLIQSPKRKASYFLFHERVTGDTLSLLLSTRYLGGHISRLTESIAGLQTQLAETISPSEKRRAKTQLEAQLDVLTDLHACAERLRAIVNQTDERGATVGWQPQRDDGVLINLAPLHTVMPAWAREPRLCWEALARGDYDWSHTAMRYWPDRVRRACANNASYALAHGLA